MHMKATENVNLSDLASEFFDKAKGEVKRAESMLAKYLIKNPELISQFIGDIAHQAMRDHIRRMRSKFFPNTQVPDEPARAGEPEHIKHIELSEARRQRGKWLELYYLSIGKPLGACVRSELLGEASMHEAMAAGNLVKARFMRGVAERLPDDATPVASVLTDDEIEEIKRSES